MAPRVCTVRAESGKQRASSMKGLSRKGFNGSHTQDGPARLSLCFG